MAKKTDVIKRGSTLPATWADKLKEAAAVEASTTPTAAGGWISTKSVTLSIGGVSIPGNRAPVVVLDHLAENLWYEDDYDPDNPVNPTCFAIGRDEKTLAPHPTVVAAGTAQSVTCKDCPKNKFGTADKGKGKACKNVRKIAVVVAGSFHPTSGEIIPASREEIADVPVLLYRVPPTSINAFKANVRKLNDTLGRPMWSVISAFAVIPDPKRNQMTTITPFSMINDPELLSVLHKRHEEARELVEQPAEIGERTPDKQPGKQPTKKGRK